MVNSTEATLARNNSTHCKVSDTGKYAGPLGSSPLTKVGNNASGFNPGPGDKFNKNLQEMSLS